MPFLFDGGRKGARVQSDQSTATTGVGVEASVVLRPAGNGPIPSRRDLPPRLDADPQQRTDRASAAALDPHRASTALNQVEGVAR